MSRQSLLEEFGIEVEYWGVGWSGRTKVSLPRLKFLHLHEEKRDDLEPYKEVYDPTENGPSSDRTGSSGSGGSRGRVSKYSD